MKAEVEVSMAEMVERFQEGDCLSLLTIEFRGADKAARLTQALSHMDNITQRKFVGEFLCLWIAVGHTTQGHELLREIWGNPWTQTRNEMPEVTPGLGTPLMFTLTADGRQFRCWYGVPGCIRGERVGETRHGMLFSVEGDADSVRDFMTGIVGLAFQEIHLPNGVKLFLICL